MRKINITSLYNLVEQHKNVDAVALLTEVDTVYTAIKCYGFENVKVFYQDWNKNEEFPDRVTKNLSEISQLTREVADYICRLKYRFPLEDTRFDAYWGLNGFHSLMQYNFFATTGYGRQEIRHLSSVSEVIKAFTSK